MIPDIQLGTTSADWTKRPVVLCVDDDASILNSLRRLFEREPYDLLTAETPREALELLRGRKVSMIISDQRLPGMSGIDLMRVVHNDFPDTIRVMLTAYPDSTTLRERNHLRIERYLTKPWQDDHLRSAIRHLLRRRRARLSLDGRWDSPLDASTPQIDVQERLVRAGCAGKRTAELLDRILPIMRDAASHGHPVAVLLNELPAIRDSISSLLKALMREALDLSQRAILVDRYGYARAFLQSIGRPKGIEAYGSRLRSSRPKRVLVIEHRMMNRVAIKAIVEALGHACETTRSPIAGAHRLRTLPWDRVLIDLDFPSGNGSEAVRSLLSQRLDVPVAVMSDRLYEWDDGTLGRDAIDRRILKPFSVRHVIGAV